MKLESLSIRVKGKKLHLLDQTLLPQEEQWICCDSVEKMREAIYMLRVRGAPAIGVSSSLFIGLFSQKRGRRKEEVEEAIEALIEARPTASNLRNLLEEQRLATDHYKLACSHFQKDFACCAAIAERGLPLIPDGAHILTHCNTGSLATVGVGTALGIIKEAHRVGKKIHVFVDETRPLLQGARLTAWELKQFDVPHTLICDNMGAQLMRDGRIDLALVGADCIALNGDFANKVGTYSIAVAAHYHNIPFYVAASTTTIASHCPTGKEIPVEMRPKEEVMGHRDIVWANPFSPVYNPSFDVTPRALVSAYIFEQELLPPFKDTKSALRASSE